MRPASLILPIALVFGLLALAALPSGYAQPVINGTAQYLPVVFKGGPTATPTATNPPTATATFPPTFTRTATLTLTPSTTRTPTLTPSITSTPSRTATRNPALCAAEYPTVCIPPPPPDLNCADITYRNFTVLSPDRHKFDTDNDGVGCEQN